MKKTLSVLFVLIMILGFSGCAPTTYTEQGKDYVYSVGETINILDKESKQILSSVTITDAIVIKDELFFVEELVKYDDNNNPIYEKTSYEAVVQINYKYSIIDSTKRISAINFSAVDSEGNRAEFFPKTNYKTSYTNDNSFVIALKEKGEFVNLSFQYHTNQTAIAQIKAYYEDVVNKDKDKDKLNEGNVEQNNTPIVDNDSNNTPQSDYNLQIFVGIFIAQALLNIVLIILVIILCVQHFKKHKNSCYINGKLEQ